MICVLALNGCGGGGSVTSNVASGGPVSIELIRSKPWGVNNTGILKQTDGDSVFLYFANDVTEQLKYDGTISNPNDYEVVSEIDVRVDNNGVVHGELILRYKATGES